MNSKNSSNRRGFTFIEVLIALAILGILFVPVMQLFSNALYFSSYSQDIITATNLAKWEMERVKNVNLTKVQLKELDDLIYPPTEEPPLKMNGLEWRIKREIIQSSDPVEVKVSVFRDKAPDKPIISLVTLVEDMTWLEVKAK